MNSNQVNIGLVGCGGMARILTQELLHGRPQLRVTALYDPDKNATRAMRDTLTPQARVCRSHEELSASPDVDWVLIASWNCFHKEQAVAAFKGGKHVFCQKPIALSLNDCLAIRNAQRRSGKMFTTGFTLRYSPHYRALRQLIEEGAVGELVSFEFNETLDFNHGGYIMANWRRLRENAGTHLLEKCCHDIDLANWMTGSRARRVASFGGLNFFTPKNQRHVERIGKNGAGRFGYRVSPPSDTVNPFTCRKDIFDNQVAIIEYENGVRATFHTNCNAGIPERRMYILGTEGAIRANVLTGEIETRRIGFETQTRRVDAGVQGGHGGGDEILAQELADSMLHGRPPAAGLEEGLTSAVTCFAIDRAADTGRVVDLTSWWARVDRNGK